MLMHLFKEAKVQQMEADGKIAKQDIPKGWVNATQMCRPYGKQFSDYARLTSTQAFIQALSDDTELSVPQLIIRIRASGDSGLQGAWVHPQIAIDLAGWLSPEFKVRVYGLLVKSMVSASTVPRMTSSDKIKQIRSMADKALQDAIKTSFVYFLQNEDSGWVKIGYSNNPKQRIRTLQNNSLAFLKLLLLIPGSRETEQKYHEKFAEFRVKGEWFLAEILKSPSFLVLLKKFGDASDEK